jgi:hypothetical protein
MNELLDFFQYRRAFRVVELDRLLLVQSIDIRIAAIGLGAALDYEGLDARCRLAEGGIAVLDDVLELLVGVASEEAARSSGRSLARIPTA